jgi:hypothetical protein
MSDATNATAGLPGTEILFELTVEVGSITVHPNDRTSRVYLLPARWPRIPRVGDRLSLGGRNCNFADVKDVAWETPSGRVTVYAKIGLPQNALSELEALGWQPKAT